MSRPAVFLDRDGTIIRDLNYIGNPEQVELLPGAAAAIARLNAAGLPVIVVTNQSGIARGLFTEADYEAVRRRLDELLAETGARVDATYLCPHHPAFGEPCECRKPRTLLFRRAAERDNVDPARSWYVGDRLRDVIPARDLGGRGILVPAHETQQEDVDAARQEFTVAHTLDEAVDRIMESAR